MSQVPSFNLGKTKINADEYNSELASAASNSKGFGPGNYTVLLKNVQYHKNRDTGAITCKSDSSWVNVSMELVGADGRTKKHYIQVPFATIHFTTAAGKKIMFPYLKLVEFMAGVGESLNADNFAQVIGQYFATEAALANLEGAEINIDIGFKGPYVKYAGENDFQIVIGGEVFGGEKPLSFPDADSAVVYAATELGKTLERWPEVIKVHAAQAPALKKQVNEAW